MFYFAGIIITLFLAIMLWSKKGKTVADGILAAWLCVMGFHLFLYYFHVTGEIYKHTYLLGIQIPMPLLHGPFLYLYTVTTTHERNRLPKFYPLHFLPAAFAWAALIQYFILPVAQKIDIYRHNGAGYELYMQIIFIAFTISGFAYVLLSFVQLKEYRKRIADEFSNTERINLNWLRYLIYGILALWTIILLGGGDALIYGVVVVFVSLLGYFGIKHMGIFTYRHEIVHEPLGSPVYTKTSVISGDTATHMGLGNDDQQVISPSLLRGSGEPTLTSIEPVVIKPALERIKYEKSGLQKAAADRIHSQLVQLMKTAKLFTEEELSLAQLAQQLDVHPNHLSQVINTYEGNSFYDYINTLRIEEFKSLAILPENSRYTLLSLAFKCGFNSKTSFNRNFKKITGKSPSAFLKEMNVHLVKED